MRALMKYIKVPYRMQLRRLKLMEFWKNFRGLQKTLKKTVILKLAGKKLVILSSPIC